MGEKLILTVFREGVLQTQGAQMAKSWEEIAAFVQKPLPDGGKPKTAYSLWAFASYPNNTYQANHAQNIRCLVLDYDGDPDISAERIEEMWGEVAYAAHTTFSNYRPKHGAPPMPRWRVIIPLARAVSVEENAAILDWARLRSSSIGDVDPGQWFIMPVNRAATSSKGAFASTINNGPWLDPDQCLRELARVRDQRGRQEQLKRLRERGAMPIAELLGDALKTLDERTKGLEPPVPVPWPTLGHVLGGGLRPGIHLVTGVPGSGRTQLALEIAMCAAQSYVPTLYVGLSVGPQQLITRALGIVSGTSWSTLWNGASNEALEAAKGQATELAGLPLSLQTATRSGWGADYIYDYAETFAVAHEARPFLFVLDGVQLLAAPGNTPALERRQRVLRAIAEARAAVQNLGAVVVMVSHTNHAGAVHPEDADASSLLGRDPLLRELEAAADTALPLVSTHEGVALGLGKVRASDGDWPPRGWIHLRAENGRFVE
ncbi:MAG: hypothetical protein EP330_01570 [Deltaproteobacteria bacterium]|nr:MAG: hypothetical protein EP330_01570 [Deltaproteobacteria bacterium]